MGTSLTSLTLVRSATNGGSWASALSRSSASTVHQREWPPAEQEPSVECRRRGLSKPRQAAKATRHSSGWCWWASMKRGIPGIFALAQARLYGGNP